MSFAYNIKDQGALHFLTFTVHHWADVFTRLQYVDMYLDSLQYCQQEKGLLIYGWVVMTNHIHLLARAEDENLSDIVRDHKKYTAKKIYAAIQANEKESRKEWLSLILQREGHIWFWEEGYHGEAIYNEIFFLSKLEYIHQNPVRAGFVDSPEHYVNSSAADYSGLRKGRLTIFGL
jgi:REP element-mobilizing transposase RayT